MPDAQTVPSNIVDFRRPPPMSERDSSGEGSIRQIIGETHATVRFLSDQLKDIREERKQFEEKIWIELRTIKHDFNKEAQLLSLRQELSDRRAGEIERRLGETSAEVKGLAADLKPPVQSLVELRKWVKWLVGIAGASFFVLVAFGRPWYDSWVASWFGHGK